MAKLKLDPPNKISLGEATLLSKLSIFNLPNMFEVDALGVEGNRTPTTITANKIPVNNEILLIKVFMDRD